MPIRPLFLTVFANWHVLESHSFTSFLRCRRCVRPQLLYILRIRLCYLFIKCVSESKILFCNNRLFCSASTSQMTPLETSAPGPLPSLQSCCQAPDKPIVSARQSNSPNRDAPRRQRPTFIPSPRRPRHFSDRFAPFRPAPPSGTRKPVSTFPFIFLASFLSLFSYFLINLHSLFLI